MNFLGDFGGFNDAIYLLLSLPMSYYSSAMYSKHIASHFNLASAKTKRKKRRIENHQPHEVEDLHRRLMTPVDAT